MFLALTLKRDDAFFGKCDQRLLGRVNVFPMYLALTIGETPLLGLGNEVRNLGKLGCLTDEEEEVVPVFVSGFH